MKNNNNHKIHKKDQRKRIAQLIFEAKIQGVSCQIRYKKTMAFCF